MRVMQNDVAEGDAGHDPLFDHGKNPAQQTNGNGKNYQFICYHETGSLTISNQMNWNEFGKIDLNCLIKQAQG